MALDEVDETEGFLIKVAFLLQLGDDAPVHDFLIAL